MKNLTPHDVVLYSRADGATTTFPASGQVMRLPETDARWSDGDSILDAHKGVPIVHRHLEAPRFDPHEPAIVSLPVLQALAAQGVYPANLFAPDTGKDCIRDERGQIKGVRRFIRLDPPFAILVPMERGNYIGPLEYHGGAATLEAAKVLAREIYLELVSTWYGGHSDGVAVWVRPRGAEIAGPNCHMLSDAGWNGERVWIRF